MSKDDPFLAALADAGRGGQRARSLRPAEIKQRRLAQAREAPSIAPCQRIEGRLSLKMDSPKNT